MITRRFSLFAIFAAISVAQTISTYAGNGVAGYGGDGGPATQALINRVDALAMDGAGNLYMADEKNNRVRKIDSNGVITTFAGTGTAGFSGDGGLATQAQLNAPTGVCTDTSGNVFINDISNFRVRKVSPGGVISTVAGNGQGSSVIGTTYGTLGDGGQATNASFSIVIRCATDHSGNLFVVDQGAHCVRKINLQGIISTFAGHCVAAAASNGYSGDGGPATSAVFNNPTAVSFDPSGNLYITDQANHRIRKVDATTNIITTVFGNGTQGSGGDGGLGTSASIAFPGSTVFDAAGVMYVADTVGHKIRKMDTNGIVSTIAGNGAAGYGGDGGPALQATLNDPFPITLDFEGNVYFGEFSNNRIRVISGGATVIPPALDSSSLANGATYVAGGLVPGSWAQVKGSTISSVTRIWNNADFVGLGSGLPTALNGVSVTVNGKPAAVYYISPTQVSFQVPEGVNGQVTVQVKRNGVVSNTVTGTATPSSPGIFPLIVNSKNYPAGVFTDGKFTGDPAANPAFRKAKAGESVQLFATGLGLSPAGSTITPFTVSGVTVKVGSTVIFPDYAGLAAVGEYQINFKVPALTTGEYPVTISVNGVSSPATINSDPAGAIVLPIE